MRGEREGNAAVASYPPGGARQRAGGAGAAATSWSELGRYRGELQEEGDDVFAHTFAWFATSAKIGKRKHTHNS